MTILPRKQAICEMPKKSLTAGGFVAIDHLGYFARNMLQKQCFANPGGTVKQEGTTPRHQLPELLKFSISPVDSGRNHERSSEEAWAPLRRMSSASTPDSLFNDDSTNGAPAAWTARA